MVGLDGGPRLFYARAVVNVNVRTGSAASSSGASLPIGDAGPDAWLDGSPVTRALISLNLAVFLMEAALARSLSDVTPRLALELGASYGLATIGEMRWETLVTACFLHAGLIHLLVNMVVLWNAGPLAERTVGSARLAAVFLLAGVVGNGAGVAVGWFERSGASYPMLGASGAISGLIAAALVMAWRSAGYRHRLTQALAAWLGVIVVFSVLSNFEGNPTSGAANAAHAGGALAGVAIAAIWRRNAHYTGAVTNAVVGACTLVLVGCIGVVAVRDRVDPFATMMLRERSEYTHDALADGRCGDAQAGLAAVERLRARMAPVTSLRAAVEATCGHVAP
jgi:rhomboid protease GluP